MRNHTTVNLDVDLLREAGEVLGTSRTIDTIHAAFAAIIRRHRRMAIVDLRPALDLSDLDALRAHRFADDRAT